MLVADVNSERAGLIMQECFLAVMTGRARDTAAELPQTRVSVSV